MSVEQEVQQIIIQTLNVLPEELKIDERLYDSLGVDSTEMVELVIVLEKKFGITIEDKQITKFSSPREIIMLMEQKRGTA
ncbi:MAG: acyl carrier protein [Deltaproteobacteria bacterium]|nr:acyl carrier protein [Deltaproteobacteria bacterium]